MLDVTVEEKCFAIVVHHLLMAALGHNVGIYNIIDFSAANKAFHLIDHDVFQQQLALKIIHNCGRLVFVHKNALQLLKKHFEFVQLLGVLGRR